MILNLIMLFNVYMYEYLWKGISFILRVKKKFIYDVIGLYFLL